MTCSIILSTGSVAYCDDEDLHLLKQYSWWEHKASTTTYAATHLVGGQVVFMHQIVLREYEIETDHRNHEGLDNRKCNLFKVTRRINNLNRRGITGIKRRVLTDGSERFDARMSIDDVSYHFGTFKSRNVADRLMAYNRRQAIEGRELIAFKRENRWSTLKKLKGFTL